MTTQRPVTTSGLRFDFESPAEIGSGFQRFVQMHQAICLRLICLEEIGVELDGLVEIIDCLSVIAIFIGNAFVDEAECPSQKGIAWRSGPDSQRC